MTRASVAPGNSPVTTVMSRMLLALAPVMPQRAYARLAPAARPTRWRAAHPHRRVAERPIGGVRTPRSAGFASTRARRSAQGLLCRARSRVETAAWAGCARWPRAPTSRSSAVRRDSWRTSPWAAATAKTMTLSAFRDADQAGRRARSRSGGPRRTSRISSPPPRGAARRDPRQSRRAGHARAGPHGIRPEVRQRATLPASDRLDRSARAHLTAKHRWRARRISAGAAAPSGRLKTSRGRRCT
jgi:hypothetical protein